MPAATTHVAFARDVLRLDAQVNRLVRNRQMYLLGSQGPDLLFFSRASILPGSLKKYGNLMHEHKIYEIIHYFENYAKNDPDLTSYLYGYLCHYALDSTAHPLVYAVTSSLCQNSKDRENETHVGLEAEIDVWIMHQRGKDVSAYDVYRDLKVSPSCTRKLARMYNAMFRDILHLDISEKQFEITIREISLWTGVLRPRRSVYRAIRALEVVLHTHAISNMMLIDKADEMIVNIDHLSYTLPWKPYDTINASFPQLYGKAFTKACRLILNRTKEDFNLDFNGIPVAQN
ncbi:MAG: zinc dependent phospholipase C family protein [Bulleidia sp.]